MKTWLEDRPGNIKRAEKNSLFEAPVRQRVPVVTASLQFEMARPAPSTD